MCVSTFIGRGVSGGDLFTAHSKVGEEDRGEEKGEKPPVTVARMEVKK